MSEESTRLEAIGGENWEALVNTGLSVLVIGKSDCAACNTWSAELTEQLAGDEFFPSVKFGKMLLDQRGLIGFKRASPWLAEVTDLPFNVIFRDGEPVKKWAGGGVERLENRLRRYVD